MRKEIVFITNGPAFHKNQKGYAAEYFLKFFDKVHFIYWSHEEFKDKYIDDKIVLHPYITKRGGFLLPLFYIFWSLKKLFKLKEEFKSKNSEGRLVFCAISVAWAGIPALIAAKMMQIPVALRMDSDMVGYMSIENKLLGKTGFISNVKLELLKTLHYSLLPFFDAVIGISEGISEKAKKYGAKNVFTIHIPINTDMFSPATGGREGIRLLYAGQIKAMKGLHILVDVLRQIKKEKDYAPLLHIVGSAMRPVDKSYKQQLIQDSQDLNVKFSDHVYIDKMPDIYREHDILVHPSYSEAQGMTIMEAMASGLAVVAFNTSGPKDLVEEGRTGFLVSSGDKKVLKERIETFLNDANLCRQMGIAGRNRVIDLVEETDEKYEHLWKMLTS
ncbi:MAG: glycosyltransferase family 4 protein [Candidatus Spechtbacterales bacterium]|nr:glycosyltransferase family 4 protein [Candidatus Spechtbacterales bacterium]